MTARIGVSSGSRLQRLTMVSAGYAPAVSQKKPKGFEKVRAYDAYQPTFGFQELQGTAANRGESGTPSIMTVESPVDASISFPPPGSRRTS